MPPSMPPAVGPRPPRTPSAVTALVPLRTGGKSRLREALDPGRRAALVLAMLDDVLAALRGAGIVDVRVLAGDQDAAGAASERGLAVLPDPAPDTTSTVGSDGSGGLRTGTIVGAADERLRAAVDAGLATVGPARTRLVVAGDLPLLRPDDVTAVLVDDAAVVVAPTAGGGTAMLRLAPGVALATRYGGGSAAAHVALAREAGWGVSVHDLAGARQDVDGPEDLGALGALAARAGDAVGAATAAFLAAAGGRTGAAPRGSAQRVGGGTLEGTAPRG